MAGAMLLVLAVAGAIVWPVLVAGAVWLRWRRGHRRPSPGSWIFVTVVSVFWALGVWAFLIEPQTLAVRHVEVVSPRWNGPDLRIGLISDTHAGAPHVDARRVARVVARMNAEAPDIVVLIGDYAGGHEPAAARSPEEREAVLSGLPPFAALDAPLGVVGVLGNHDWWFDGPGVERALEAAGVTMLENAAVRVDREGGAFWVAGLADVVSERVRPSYEDALAAVPEGEPVIVLSHWPDPFAAAPDGPAITLSGHSHCGQVNLPVLGRPILPSAGSQRWPCGLYDDAGRKLLVTGGVGVSMMPVRFGAPPEIVILTLRSAS
jgi:predicted MPP superfamily phosphohydrolase